ncbi:unnamed protein product (macronuclear) [Paramecium tetraurelia]|uniref:Ion transport domain-containing protein n=1 Tax=Paramecium tetraurelia TaxID=5888 RepID=A0E749_PARTE|nr:uncharacterized protein GSPATT00023844001 [Paramecium tetraurelia]CAK91116.1 unnamed protein product [Paramecium tetraurelia]|eukprot:XP_001458513.1 hypothetical protein (macronuclear) [Paramecium tetraurelia strain d4-2]
MNKPRFLLQFALKEAKHQEDKRIELEAMNNVEKEIQQFENSEQIDKIISVWKLKPLKIIQKIAIFITKMKHYSPIYRFKILNKNIFYLIRDRTSSFQYYLYSGLLENKPTRVGQMKYEGKLANALCNQTVLLPADKFLFVWDVILMFVTIMNILYVPLQLSFDLSREEIGNAYLLFSTLPSCIFLVELVLNFFKGYYVRGILHTSKRDIFWHYVKGEFIIDLTVVLPFILSWFGYSFANYLMLIRMTKVRRTMVVIEEISNFKEKTAVIYSLFCLIYSLLLISHFCACLFHYFAILEVDNGYTHTWLHQQGIYEADAYVKYFTSLYWVTITSMTVGYGDIVPVTTPEKILVTFLTFLVVGTFGYALGMIQSIFYKLAEQQNLNNAKLRLVSNHIKQRGLNTQLQFRVRKYIEYYLQFKQEEELDLDELMGQLNPKLKQEVQIAINLNCQGQISLMTSLRNFAFAFMKELMPLKNLSQRRMTILINYTLCYREESSQYYQTGQLKDTQVGKLVCEREFFFQDYMQFDMVAQTFVQVAYINQTDFLNILQNDNAQYEKLQYLLWIEAQFGDNNNQIICEACSSHHQFKHCPLVFFRKNKNKVISIYNSSVDHERHTFIRQRKKTRINSQLIKERALDQILEQNKTLAAVDSKFLIKLGIQRNDEDESSYPDQTVVQHSQQGSLNQPDQRLIIKGRGMRQVSHRSLLVPSGNNAQETQEDNQTYIFNAETNVDKVEEYDYYYPHYNITKVIKLINNYNIYSRVLEKIRGHKNRFAQYIARQIMYKIL